MSPWKALLPAAVLAAVVGLGSGCGPEENPEPGCNVLLVTLDTTRADHLGLYGHAAATSPVLDAFAAQAAVFERAIAQAAVTPVSHASILTGLNPYHHGLRVLHGHVGFKLEPQIESLPETWTALGGETAAFVSAFPVTETFGLDQGFAHFDAEFPQADGEGLITEEGFVNTGASQRRADLTTDRAIAWLNEHCASDEAAPFLLWVHYFDPHDPALKPPERELQRMLKQDFVPHSRGQRDMLRAIYDAEIRYMDFHLGRLLRACMRSGVWDETMVVIVADHGEGLGDHDWWTHGILYEEQIRVPLVVRLPDMEAGLRVPSLVRTIDLVPTILDVAAVPRAEWPRVDGVSLTTAIETGQTETPLLGYSDSINMLNYQRPGKGERWNRKDDKLYCLTEGDAKLIYHQLNPEETEFYDLSTDPKETHNLADRHPPAMVRLLRKLKQLGAFSDILPGMTPSDPERVARLRSLGYVE